VAAGLTGKVADLIRLFAHNGRQHLPPSPAVSSGHVRGRGDQVQREGLRDRSHDLSVSMMLTTRLDLNHLRRETRTALELALVEFAPKDLIERLALTTGLLEALAELPPESAPAIALVPGTVDRARAATDAWRDWASKHTKRA
jgi:hypothetical protein